MNDPMDLARGARRALARLALPLALGAALAAPVAAQYTISQYPMLVAAPPPPNIVFTIDDSGSMTWAYVPDAVGQYAGTAGFTSSSYNALYYSPLVTYPTPPDANGGPVPQAQCTPNPPGCALTSFTGAYNDGFNPSQTSPVNLQTSYSPTLSYQPGSGGPQSATGTTGPAYYYLYGGSGSAIATCPALAPGAQLDPTVAPPADTCFTQVTVGSTSGPAICSGSSGPVLCSSLPALPAPTVLRAAGWDETQNFANWYSFYRTRHLAIISAAAQAMQDKSLANARVAWQALNSCPLNAADLTAYNCYGWLQDQNFDNRISQFIGPHKAAFYNWLFELPANQSTPTRKAFWRAGEYYRTSGPNSPYGVNPNPGTSGTAAAPSASTDLMCVNDFHVTLTDGLWNNFDEGGQTNFCGTGACGNADASSVTLPDTTTYTPNTSATLIFGDGRGGGDSIISGGGLADIAFYYWATNLRPDLNGFRVAPYVPDTSTTPAYWNPKNDPATWPHMVNFTVGVGLTGFLSLPGLEWTGDSLSGTAYNNLLTAAPNCSSPSAPSTTPPFSTACTWPDVITNASGGGFTSGATGNGNVYDLWHAAINSRGKAFSAETPQDLVSAMGAILARVAGQTLGNTAAAGSSPSLTASTQLYVASYVAQDWHGMVSAYPVALGTGAVGATPTWQTSASSIPAFGSRKVFTAQASVPYSGNPTVASPGINFTVSDLTTYNSLISYFGDTTANQTLVVNYLRGDPSNQQSSPGTGGLFRYRSTPLGDIVDSNPVFSWQEDFGYANLSTAQGGGSYAAFVAGKANRTPMVYAGANDGMLHGFDATNPPSTGTGTSGNEVFAYVPHGVLPSLGKMTTTTAGASTSASAVLSGLVDPNYLHAFYVDGPVFVGDAYFTTPGSGGMGATATWHSVLLGTTGAGGPGIFALDVTNPQSFSTASVLWDMDGSTTGNSDPNLGATIGTPIIALLNSGDWAAVFGNGYNSPRGCALLYVVRLVDGKVLGTIDTSGAAAGATAACTGSAGTNGLGSPTLLDLDQNGTTDYVFAGDLQGHLWKFDLTDASPANWKVAYSTAAGAPAPLITVSTTATTVVGGVTTTTTVPQPIVAAPNLGPSPGNLNSFLVYFVTGRMFANGDASDTRTESVYAVQDAGVPITTGRANLVAQKVALVSGTPNLDVTTPYATVDLTQKSGWYIDLLGTSANGTTGVGERALNTPFLIGGLMMFSTVTPQAQPCNGGCGGFVYAVNQFSGDGNTGFLTQNGVSYDALATGVGCVRGLTMINQGQTLNLYASGSGAGSSAPSSVTAGPSNGSGGGSGGGTTPGTTPTPNTSIEQFQGKLQNLGRISWHEVVNQ
jgi:type IV pilus assembly protein PilY1